MKHLRKIHLAICLVTALAVTGCATLAAVNWPVVVQTIAHIGVALVAKNNPNLRPQIEFTSALFDSFIASKQTDVTKLQGLFGTQLDPELMKVLAAGLDEIGPQVASALTADTKLVELTRGLRALQAGLAGAVSHAPASAPPGVRAKAVDALKKRGVNL